MRVALIGHNGYWGSRLKRALEQTGNEIVHLIDRTNEAELEDTDADVAVIATPPDTHYKLAMRAMKIGMDVLVEKPMAMKLSQATEMALYAAENGIVLGVDSTFVHTAAFDFLYSLGQPLISYQSCRLAPPMPQAQINAGWDLVCHDISILNALSGVDKTTKGVGAEDGSVASAAIPLSTGGSAFVFASRAWHTKVREIVLHYPRATYIWDLKGVCTVEGEPIVNETFEPLKKLIMEFEDRVSARAPFGKTDGLHGAEVVGCLERLFPTGSSVGVTERKVGNGLYRPGARQHL